MFHIIALHRRFYQKTKENAHIGTDRRCAGCYKTFKIGDYVSVAITDEGNKCLCDNCAEGYEEE